MTSLDEGSLIAGQYRLEFAMREGGMGTVWAARHVRLDMRVAVKLMHQVYAEQPSLRSRFEREAMATARIQSPHVVQILDTGAEGGIPYLVMELLDGEDLSTRLRRVKRLPVDEVAKLMRAIARALHVAHEVGVVHRDLKPANVFLWTPDSENEVVKVLDFGAAKDLRSAEDMTKTGERIGSPHYMSPEQVRGARDLDHRSDLWSLAALAFRALTGRLPFSGDSEADVLVKICRGPTPLVSETAPDLGTDLDAFFLRALARDPRERFQTARAMARAFSVMVYGAALRRQENPPPPSSV